MIDRWYCRLLGHTWEPLSYKDASRCPHCLTQMSAIEVIAYWRRRLGSQVAASDALRLGCPRRGFPKRWL